ncbi:2Fe-2S iron-sulfur cluster binding domain-containing protein [Shewanella psychropiezotolerans]|uniref:2Fe-2S iron-sulfur cluster binding domain-containing protein n=1 Tax=Shewanella psychropiezotolerans TaxID=2593655 RepID=A0ABX5X200_9GAMM|nr:MULTISPECIES: 2Fe-2S iron-sulfur cluster-binding protein [Shewanella]MPY22349.1 2Fe-2S iron-sulfur cluster binding domain-containing protein [Shewanella sp. YLB-07]QDO83316.1 2Fe-2S iron-sulfur cluster binding domain-containing protein [Shewanella psychropiezotolerans]
MSSTQLYSLKISQVQPETESAVCISFEVPQALKDVFRFKPGQFLTLEIALDGQKIRRAYSICSGVDDTHLRVGIKRIKHGQFSNYANDHFKVGDIVSVLPPQGNFYPLLYADDTNSYMCLAVGSGITPILSIIKSILSSSDQSKVTLIYGNKRTKSVMFKEELSFIKNRYLARFKWINIMSQEDQGSDVLNGKIDNDKGYQLQKKKMIDIHNTAYVFICGPESMISEVSRGFRLEGLNQSQIHYELFAHSAVDSEVILEKSLQRVHEYGENKTSQLTLISDGRAINFELATVGSNILDAGIENGLDLPFSCKAGVCSTCKAKVIKGKVDMDISHGLAAHEIEQGFILTCQAHPLSDELVVSFDER